MPRSDHASTDSPPTHDPRGFVLVTGASSGIGAACGFVGMNLSYHLDVPSGTTIVLTGAAVFTVVLMVTGGRGLRRTSMMDSHAEPTPAPAAVVR